MTKKYKLLKPLPGSKPGDIYVWNNSQKVYYKDGNVLDIHFMKESVEDYADWFQEIKEDKPQWEIVEMKNSHNLCLKKNIKGWEKVSVFSGNAHNNREGVLGASIIDCRDIYSVKRLSDGEVFSIGDFFTIKGNVTKYAIAEFCFDYTGKHLCVSNAGLPKCRLTKIKKAKEPEMVRVINLSYDYFRSKDCVWADTYEFRISSKKLISVDKFPAIKKAIEDCLNVDTEKIFNGCCIWVTPIQKAFRAGRATDKYATFQDYLSSLKQ